MRIPETHKLPGVCYAFSPQGMELPVVDVSLPLFRNETGDEELFARGRAYAESLRRPGILKMLFYRFVVPHYMKRSIMGRGLMKASGGYLDGLTTYLLKLPPEAMGAWATQTDRKIAQGLRLSARTVSLRLQDMAELQSRSLLPHLQTAPQAELHFVNIAGGPSIDSLNTLILLQKTEPGLLSGRRIRIHTLDLESDGFAFGHAASMSLLADGAPLQGLDLQMERRAYDWDETGPLKACLRALPGDAVLAIASEGGLFDYGSDAALSANLKALRELGPSRKVLAGSISRPDGVAAVPSFRMASLVLRTPEDFETLAGPAGWKIEDKRGRPMSWVLSAAPR